MTAEYRNTPLKKLIVSICDIRTELCRENCFSSDMSVDDSPTHLISAMNIREGNQDVSVDDLFLTSKRKRNGCQKKLSLEEETDSSEEEEVHRTVKKKIVKIISGHKDEDDKDSSHYEDEDETDSDYYPVYQRGKKFKNRKKEIIPKSKKSSLSSYEKMIEEKRNERMAFLQSIKIDEVKAGFSKVADVIRKKKTPVKRVFKEKEVLPIRKSKRLAGININLSENSLFAKVLEGAEGSRQDSISIPPELSFKEALNSEEIYEDYVKDVQIQVSKSEQKFFSYDNDRTCIKNFSLKEYNIVKVSPARITALSWYPSAKNLIVAAGDKMGNFSIWNMDSKSDPYVFKIHLFGITNVNFNACNPDKLISSSYDGTIRCCDMVNHMFNEVYDVSDKTSCTYFDFLSPTTYLVSQSNGEVALIDVKTEGKKSEKRHTCHDYSIKTVNVHPVNKNVFVTADNKKTVRLWDLRKLQKEPVVEITQHERCVNSAFFSPVTGNSILTTSLDDSVCIFDSTNLTEDIKCKRRMKHNNYTGRWLSIFRATWLPNSDEAFVIGCVGFHPRRIQIFDKDMNIYHTVMHENLGTITSLNVFHPFRPVLAAGNSSGKLYVFT